MTIDRAERGMNQIVESRVGVLVGTSNRGERRVAGREKCAVLVGVFIAHVTKFGARGAQTKR